MIAADLVVVLATRSGPVTALAHSGLHVAAGTSLAIMGPSGCGKSTLLGLLAGLAVPSSGTVTVGDTVVSELDERARVRFRRRWLGMIYQTDNLLPHLTVEENVALASSIGDRSGDDTGDVLDILGLGDLNRRFPDELSGGQRQRVAVARAIISRPPLILADEPTGALDEANAAAVIALLVDAQRRLGSTLVVVTHDAAIAARLDRVEHLTRPAPAREVAGVG